MAPEVDALRKPVAVCVALFVAALHVLIGPDYAGPFPAFAHGYLIDVTLPLSLFLLSGVGGHGLTRRRGARAMLIFAVGATIEIAQGLGYPVFGSVFDPLDFVAYAGGVAAGVVLEGHLDRLAGARATT